ncbi:Uncharacterized protein TOPH_05247 [Tolypocladium ophioglossoides CBS 100239]|uniref:Uncharacterized protein n=1 Tax=Tolypocladium ophioglossoides (strain CBS 100239) TaxID=1163406 RepID=A0A0L0N7W6_TOLOC|nr:Uncharacterized protein TOPH_05247 [Tolypocladium ophioglossoides CBS 100239]
METTFRFSADANTDIWKKPPSHNVFTAPFRTHSRNSTTKFLSATLSFTATYTLQFDQAGILLVFHNPESDTPATRKWIKAGIELFDGAPRLSTVCCDAWADWSVAPAPCADDIRSGRKSVTISVEREDGASGTSLWIHHVGDGGKKTPMREICWPFGEAAGEGWELEVAAAVARPAKDTADKLEAGFDNFVVKWKDN